MAETYNVWLNVVKVVRFVISSHKFIALVIQYLSLTQGFVHVQSTLVISNSLISKWKSGPCFNTEIYQQARKYCGKEEKFLLFSTIFSIYL